MGQEYRLVAQERRDYGFRLVVRKWSEKEVEYFKRRDFFLDPTTRRSGFGPRCRAHNDEPFSGAVVAAFFFFSFSGKAKSSGVPARDTGVGRSLTRGIRTGRFSFKHSQQGAKSKRKMNGIMHDG